MIFSNFQFHPILWNFLYLRVDICVTGKWDEQDLACLNFCSPFVVDKVSSPPIIIIWLPIKRLKATDTVAPMAESQYSNTKKPNHTIPREKWTYVKTPAEKSNMRMWDYKEENSKVKHRNKKHSCFDMWHTW